MISPIRLSASVSMSCCLIAWWHCSFLLFSNISNSDCDLDSDSMTMARIAENTANFDAFGKISMRLIFDSWSWLLTALVRLRLRRRFRFPRLPLGDFLKYILKTNELIDWLTRDYYEFDLTFSDIKRVLNNTENCKQHVAAIVCKHKNVLMNYHFSFN